MTTTAIDPRTTDYLEAEQRLLDRYDLEAERFSVAVDAVGGQVAGLTTGDGPPVLMVVGGGPPMGIWIPLMAELTGLRLHAIELPGIGLTTPTSFTVDNHRSTAVAIIDQTMDALGLDAAPLASQSMGGLWSLWFALDRPERVPAVSILSCPATMLGTSAPLPMRLMTLPGVAPLVDRLDPPSPKQVDRFIRMAGESFTGREMRALFLAVERLPTYGESLRNLVRAAVRLRGAQPAVMLTEADLGQLSVPVQLIWGDHDPFGPPAVGRRAVGLIPDAELHEVPGGHGFWVDRPAAIAALMKPFLSRATGAG